VPGRVGRRIGGMFEFDEVDKMIYAMLEGMCSLTAKEDESKCSTLDMDMDMCKDHEFDSTEQVDWVNPIMSSVSVCPFVYLLQIYANTSR
jgi:hypothetical protein